MTINCQTFLYYSSGPQTVVHKSTWGTPIISAKHWVNMHNCISFKFSKCVWQKNGKTIIHLYVHFRRTFLSAFCSICKVGVYNFPFEGETMWGTLYKGLSAYKWSSSHIWQDGRITKYSRKKIYFYTVVSQTVWQLLPLLQLH